MSMWPLKCISPNPAHFIAHSSIDFTVSLEEQDIKNTIENGSLKMCIKLEYIDPAENLKGTQTCCSNETQLWFTGSCRKKL